MLIFKPPVLKVGGIMRNVKRLVSVFLLLASVSCAAFANTDSNLSADVALKKLKEGNAHFVSSKMVHPDESVSRRKELRTGQHPFVAILSCSDSRVPPEIIFDQGLGDIFEIRNAGNVLDDHVIGSIEYAVVHAGVKLVLVMGHEDCGAVKATLGHSHESIYIESLTKTIEPAARISKGEGAELINNTAINHAKMTVKKILESDPIISEYVEKHGVKVIPAMYHLDSGKVDFF